MEAHASWHAAALVSSPCFCPTLLLGTAFVPLNASHVSPALAAKLSCKLRTCSSIRGRQVSTKLSTEKGTIHCDSHVKRKLRDASFSQLFVHFLQLSFWPEMRTQCTHLSRRFCLDFHRYLPEVTLPVLTAFSSHNTFCVRFSLIFFLEQKTIRIPSRRRWRIL